MANVLTDLFMEKVQPGLYQQYVVNSTSSWMENNAAGVEYMGGKYVIMHELSVDGLGAYDRSLGFPRGVITGSKKQYELTQDRGREFLIDAADNDETGFLVTAASVMAQFQRDHVIPEVDSYRYSTIYSEVLANAASNIIATDIDAAAITDTLLGDIAAIRDTVGDIPLVVIMSGLTQRYFGADFSRNLEYATFATGGLNTKVRTLDGNPFYVVPSARLKTEYEFYDGVTAGQEAGGFAAAEDAADMKWIITPMAGPTAVAKIDKMRAFSPDQYQSANAWKVDYRMYHDLWMMPNAYNNTIIRTGDITTA